MSEKNWKPYISRLREDPNDAEALDAIEVYLAASSEGKGRGKKAVGVMGTASRYVFKMFLGATLYRAVVLCWDAWSQRRRWNRAFKPLRQIEQRREDRGLGQNIEPQTRILERLRLHVVRPPVGDKADQREAAQHEQSREHSLREEQAHGLIDEG